jgi:hypothetical protein
LHCTCGSLKALNHIHNSHPFGSCPTCISFNILIDTPLDIVATCYLEP